ncbi:hydroxyethylthiazole kinase [Flavobacterium subsaxonicum]|uniref:Hydroxyethylthiazole kinase n=1 Tax=Flavobacterium subsaxonicum WB 4.1-42 = DSM 21790 TaxID=1121898 RepID=A0A0A2N1H9_9FLAO|nr:hydroxyethylthiazole kinase [Flavobacterium subsaxonicum]KGO94315.1 hydroxyethylthiazole kinase [Flavobacterium subsaxonicum WB 4.1-42 = DSM 21790]
MKESLWEAVLSVKKNSPLVHNITNYVVMNNTANALLAVGASPIMAHAHPEVADMVAICSATVINIGTLDEYWVQSMLTSAAKAKELGKPWILDPVGAGATAFRNDTAAQLLTYKPTVIRGNASEIMALAKVSQQQTKGVDSVHQSTEAVDAAKWLNQTTGAVVCVSGATDVVVSGHRKILLNNGHALMQQVTGLGCTATALIGAFVGNNTTDPFQATTAAMALLSIAGEIAQKQSAGPGSLQVNLLDKLYNITEAEFYSHLKMEEYNE